ncbi:hypothetical protein Atep_27870 [Allochromatium tepidum]|uniref:Transposase n=1 Tax=Allochromatium tepidum TaxID=553982 RepID=A0ABM7QPN9_9GAMM|nr:hypothetical protein Atep_27870 [Allochromatium tepidum]
MQLGKFSMMGGRLSRYTVAVNSNAREAAFGEVKQLVLSNHQDWNDRRCPN